MLIRVQCASRRADKYSLSTVHRIGPQHVLTEWFYANKYKWTFCICLSRMLSSIKCTTTYTSLIYYFISLLIIIVLWPIFIEVVNKGCTCHDRSTICQRLSSRLSSSCKHILTNHHHHYCHDHDNHISQWEMLYCMVCMHPCSAAFGMTYQSVAVSVQLRGHRLCSHHHISGTLLLLVIEIGHRDTGRSTRQGLRLV